MDDRAIVGVIAYISVMVIGLIMFVLAKRSEKKSAAKSGGL